MQKFEGISFVWAIILVAALTLLYAFRAWRGYRQVTQDAQDDFDYKSREGMIDNRLSEEGYIRAYKRFYAPRSLLYIAMALAAILVLTAPIMAILNYAMMQIWVGNGRPIIYAPHGFVWMFINFFSLLAAWIGIGYLFARNYHKNAPLSLRDEMIREMD